MSYDPPSAGSTPPAAAPPPPPPVPGGQARGPRGPRPSTVTAAVGLMAFLILLNLVAIVVALTNRDILEDAARAQLEAQDQAVSESAVDTQTTVSLVATVVIGLLLAVAFVVLALLLLRGSNVARIITWVVCGLFLCDAGLGTVFSALGAADSLPGWYVAYSYVTLALQVLAYVGVIVLLLLRPSNAFFRPGPATA